MVLLFLLENGSSPIISLPQFSKSFWTSGFMVFEMNSRFLSADRPGAANAKTNTCKNRAAEKIFFMKLLYSYFLLKPIPVEGRLTALPMAEQGEITPLLVWQSTCQHKRLKFSEQNFRSV